MTLYLAGKKSWWPETKPRTSLSKLLQAGDYSVRNLRVGLGNSGDRIEERV